MMIFHLIWLLMAGALLERATKKPWEELMRTELFGPLGMEGAGFGQAGRRRGAPQQPWGGDVMVADSTGESSHKPVSPAVSSQKDWA